VQNDLGIKMTTLNTNVVWLDEHYQSFLKLRETDPKQAEQELEYLGEVIKKLFEKYGKNE